MIIDMGTHMLSGHVGSQNLLQVAVPGLEDRCRTFGPLQGVLLMPGVLQQHLTTLSVALSYKYYTFAYLTQVAVFGLKNLKLHLWASAGRSSHARYA